MSQVDEIKAKAREALTAADAISKAAMAEGREMNPAELRQADGHLKAYEALKIELKQAEDAAVVKAALDAIGAEIMGEQTTGRSFLNLKAPRFVDAITDAMHPAGGHDPFRGHEKALVASGSLLTPIPVDSDYVLAGRAPTSLLDVVPVVKRDAPVYRYARETARVMNAAVVAPGAVKPTSQFTLTSIEARLKVVGHLSEPVDKYLLRDLPSTRQFVESELSAGLKEAIQAQMISGDGTGENFNGIASVAGTQALTGTPTDLLTSIRSAVTLLQNVGLVPSFVALNPTNWQIAETKRNASGNFDFGSPSQLAERKIYGMDAVPIAGLNLRKIYVVAENALQLSTDGAIDIEWNGIDQTLFSKNQLVGRGETRANLDVLQPAGVVVITFAADPS